MATRSELKAHAKRLLEDCNVTRAPVDVEMIARHLGVSVNYEPFKQNISGVLVKDTKRTVIGVNTTHPVTRQRFTIAHEIGHLVLKHKGELFVDKMVMRRDERSSQAVDNYEIEANGLAAELLMPEALILKSVVQHTERSPNSAIEDVISVLADEFQVSNQAMEYRLTNLGIYMP